jgi:hypothetical protein
MIIRMDKHRFSKELDDLVLPSCSLVFACPAVLSCGIVVFFI